MIPYETLIATIDDWKAGKRPAPLAPGGLEAELAQESGEYVDVPELEPVLSADERPDEAATSVEELATAYELDSDDDVESAPNLEPIEGVDVRQWAYIQAVAASGLDVAAALAQVGVDVDVWSRAGLAWNERNDQDTTNVISDEYRRAYQGIQEQLSGQGDRLNSEEPITIERWVEVEQALAILVPLGHAEADILAEFELSVEDWSNGNLWWLHQMRNEGHANDGALTARYQQLKEYYHSYYANSIGES